jgi:glycosyltransferase involved in cell wall biosynthesis
VSSGSRELAWGEQVLCLSSQPRKRIAAFLGMANVLVSPRSYGNNFPLKVFDYLGAGKPIVATDISAHRVVLDDSLAMLTEPRAEALASAIIRILTDSDLAVRFATTARSFADPSCPGPVS